MRATHSLVVPLLAIAAASCGRVEAEPPRAFGDAIEAARDDLDEYRGPSYGLRGTAIEDPSGHALDAAREAFERAMHREGVAHVVVYGGSHTAADLYTGVLRRSLQRGFGDLGHGWVMPVPPFEHYWQSGVRIETSEGFASVEPSLKHLETDTYGLAGMAFDADGPAYAELATNGSRASRIEVMHLAQPGGGTMRIRVDGVPFDVSTAADEARAASATIATTDGEHRIAIEALGDGPVRLYGVALGREGSGVVVDQLGLAGAKARHQLLWSEPVWSSLLASRAPDLVMVSYGNNETDDHHLSDQEHVDHFARMLARLRAHTPEASCLVLGPADRLMPDEAGELVTPPLLEHLREAQRRIAFEQGCAYFDVMGWQGGSGSMSRLRHTQPPLAREDGIHFTELGYRRLGAALTDALLDALVQPAPPASP